MPLKHLPTVINTTQTGLVTQVLMDDPNYLMDDNSAVMGGLAVPTKPGSTKIVVMRRRRT